MVKDSTSRGICASELDFYRPMPYHNDLPWLVPASSLTSPESKRFDRTYFQSKHQVLVLVLGVVVRVRDKTNGGWWSSNWIYFLGHRHHPRELFKAIEATLTVKHGRYALCSFDSYARIKNSPISMGTLKFQTCCYRPLSLLVTVVVLQ